ncbi:GGDEF domain-containing protein [Rhizobiaceae sp. 2RAB30]
MNGIALRSGCVALCAALASLTIVWAALSLRGGTMDGNALLMSLLSPIVIAWPASAYTFSQHRRLKAAHRELARTHAQLAAAHRRLAEKANRDEMTGMLKREAFFGTIDASRRRTDRGALLIIDADHFKKINDTHGHLAGDEALLAICAAIRSGVRESDVLGRIGGEEFGALLVGATAAEARRVAERIRAEVEALRFSPTDCEPIQLTVSIGGILCNRDASVSELMRAADRRLYEAKNRGRNRAVTEPLQAAA